MHSSVSIFMHPSIYLHIASRSRERETGEQEEEEEEEGGRGVRERGKGDGGGLSNIQRGRTGANWASTTTATSPQEYTEHTLRANSVYISFTRFEQRSYLAETTPPVLALVAVRLRQPH